MHTLASMVTRQQTQAQGHHHPLAMDIMAASTVAVVRATMTVRKRKAREAVQEVAERQRAGQREGDALIAAMQL